MSPRPILVVGGGIGGLSAALALRRAGLAAEVYERAPEYREVGAGLTLAPPGLRALESLGVLEPVLAASDNVARTAFLDHATGALIRMSGSRGDDGAHRRHPRDPPLRPARHPAGRPARRGHRAARRLRDARR